MRKAILAETILSLAATPERAAAMTGDFLEEHPGALRFGLMVGRTVIAQALRQITARPREFAGLALKSMAGELACFLAVCVMYVVLLYIAICISMAGFHTSPPDWFDTALGWVLVNAAAPFCVGRWMSRRYAGREAAGALTLAGLHIAVNLCAGLVFGEAARRGVEWHCDVTLGLTLVSWYSDDVPAILRTAILYATLYPLALLVGATALRRRSYTKV
jgi:hypothetical protein